MKKALPCVITVCNDCEHRHVGCHSKCAPYLAQKEEQKRLMDEKNSNLNKTKKEITRNIYYKAVRKKK